MGDLVRTSFDPRDVLMLLTDVTGKVELMDTARREGMIQSGAHYSEMLPVEYTPTAEYLRVFSDALRLHSRQTAQALARASEQIFSVRGKNLTLVSLARAGTPAGVLIRRYLRKKYGFDPQHYSISIIRGRGIDHNAMKYILERHDPRGIQFVDGWTGKGAIADELSGQLTLYPDIPRSLAVLSDPAHICDIFGTREDILIASSCLNATVSGLVSRTFKNSAHLGENDFHGAVYYGDLAASDMTHVFLDSVESEIDYAAPPLSENSCPPDRAGLMETASIAERFGVKDINFVKPGIGEATRVLLRRLPRKILVRDLSDTGRIGHLLRLADEKGAEVLRYPLKHYHACGIIKDLSADL